MRINAKLSVNDLVVFNHSLDATVFRVKLYEKGSYSVGVVDRALEGQGVAVAIQWVDKSSILTPTVGQLKQITAATPPTGPEFKEWTVDQEPNPAYSDEFSNAYTLRWKGLVRGQLYGYEQSREVARGLNYAGVCGVEVRR